MQQEDDQAHTHGKQTQMVMQKSVALTITRHLEGLRQIFFTVWVSLLRLCKWKTREFKCFSLAFSDASQFTRGYL